MRSRCWRSAPQWAPRSSALVDRPPRGRRDPRRRARHRRPDPAHRGRAARARARQVARHPRARLARDRVARCRRRGDVATRARSAPHRGSSWRTCRRPRRGAGRSRRAATRPTRSPRCAPRAAPAEVHRVRVPAHREESVVGHQHRAAVAEVLATLRQRARRCRSCGTRRRATSPPTYTHELLDHRRDRLAGDREHRAVLRVAVHRRVDVGDARAAHARCSIFSVVGLRVPSTTLPSRSHTTRSSSVIVA